MARYEIAFSGELVPGAQLDVVQANLAKLFQADAQRIAQLFSGRRVVIKNNLDEAAAEKYRSTLERAGARVEVVDTELPVIEEIELAPPPAEPPTRMAGEPRARLQVVPRDEYMAAFSEVDAPDFGVAGLGADLQDAVAEVPEPALDLSRFSLAPVGSDMGQAKAQPAAVAPDISHLKLV
ncbi:hypothetical protein SAMN05216588_11760 [Pseudomonas flavescens]|uniref:Ribosomal protein L7/L12 C-terminal domain-containing protein n=1 Tax=Phytopseudomonas flavescens TaxID=29435 RepID=A0A1G8KRC9_9GAMM|nr:hypothetical protein [Pseudomonas flavescens]SDI45947.1 hypothetical protein SAMN05216588_11760 [Pseudomonas flavescens]